MSARLGNKVKVWLGDEVKVWHRIKESTIEVRFWLRGTVVGIFESASGYYYNVEVGRAKEAEVGFETNVADTTWLKSVPQKDVYLV